MPTPALRRLVVLMAEPSPAIAQRKPPVAVAATDRNGGGAVGFVARLVGGVSRGEDGAMAVFYEGWFDSAFDTAKALTRRDESFCLDVVQDAMLRAIRSLRPSLGLQEKGDLDRWLARVVHTTALDHLRRESRRLARHARRAGDEARRRSGSGSGEGPGESAALAEEIELLRLRLDKLTEQDRALLALRFSHERSLESSGSAAGMTGPAAHGKIRRLLARLRSSFKEPTHDR